MSRVLTQVMNQKRLSEREAQSIAAEMMSGNLSNEETAGILSVLQFRGETAEEITGFVKGMQEKSTRFTLPYDVLDTCGTGGDETGTYNISTAVALLLSSMGVKVAKHGNRSVSSTSGSADVLSELGIPFQQNGKEAAEMLEKHNLAFLFAPIFHSAMKHVAPVRKQMGVKTVFNMLGPLTNPAGASKRLIGVYSPEAAKKMAEVSLRLNIKRAMFVCGSDGLDEITVQGETSVFEVNNGRIDAYTLIPEDLGINRSSLDGATVKTPEESARLMKAVFSKSAPESAENLLLLNAGAALYINGSTATVAEGVHESRKALGEQVLNHLEALMNEKKGAAAT